MALRKLIRFVAVAAVTAAGSASHADLPDGYDRIYLSPHASSDLVQSAHDLADLLESDYGTRPVLQRDPFLIGRRGLRIGPQPSHAQFDSDPLTDEVLIIRTGRGIEMAGSDNIATRFAVYRFIEEFLGWRYYVPGSMGLEKLDTPPPVPEIRGPETILLHERSPFFSRNPWMGRTATDPDWNVWHGVRERFFYNHTLHKIVPPLLFDSHPDWFAKDEEGRPDRPPYYPRIHGYNDHPDLSSRPLRDHVGRLTVESLERHTPFVDDGEEHDPGPARLPTVRTAPGLVSTSISLGDTHVFGEFDPSYPWNPRGYFRRWPDWSNHVFAYTNSVARTVVHHWEMGEWPSNQRPTLYLGALAYLSWENRPDFPLHPSVVPYLTFDRTQWYDPQAKQDDLANVASWADSGSPFLGTWDYLFGTGFLIPRSLVSIVSESIPALHQRGVRAYFSQMGPVWPYDGHTSWLLTRLLWDPGQDPGSLVDEFFGEFYGPAAGPMRAFFESAESIWMNQEGPSWWLRYWRDPWQAALWSKTDIAELGTMLDEAHARAVASGADGSGMRDNRFLHRVERVRDLYRATRAFHRYQHLCWEIHASASGPHSYGEASAFLDKAEAALAAREELESIIADIVAKNPYARYIADLSWVFGYDNLGATLLAAGGKWQEEALGPVLLERTDGLLRRWTAQAGFAGYPAMRPEATGVLRDNTFSKVLDRRIWRRAFMDSEKARHGPVPDGEGYRVANVRRGHLYQLFRATPGAFYLGTTDVDSIQSPSGEIYIRIDFFDESYDRLGESKWSRIAPTERYGTQQRLHALMQAPPGSTYGRLFIRFSEMDFPSEAVVTRPRVYQLPAVANP